MLLYFLDKFVNFTTMKANSIQSFLFHIFMSLSELGQHRLDQQTELDQLNEMSQLIPDR